MLDPIDDLGKRIASSEAKKKTLSDTNDTVAVTLARRAFSDRTTSLGLHLTGRACQVVNKTMENYKDQSRLDYKCGLGPNLGLEFVNATDAGGSHGFPSTGNGKEPILPFVWTGWHNTIRGTEGNSKPLDSAFSKLQKYAKKSKVKFSFKVHELTDSEFKHYEDYLKFDMKKMEPALEE